MELNIESSNSISKIDNNNYIILIMGYNRLRYNITDLKIYSKIFDLYFNNNRVSIDGGQSYELKIAKNKNHTHLISYDISKLKQLLHIFETSLIKDEDIL